MATTETDGDPPAAYEQLLERHRRITNLENAGMHLLWDEQVVMPAGGTPARSQQRAAISATAHELLVNDDVGAWLDAVDEDELTAEQAATVREIRRAHEREADVPSELVEELTQVGSENREIWAAAKADNDFDRFAPRLERLRDLQRERAACIDPGTDPYEVIYRITGRVPRGRTEIFDFRDERWTMSNGPASGHSS